MGMMVMMMIVMMDGVRWKLDNDNFEMLNQ